MKDLIQRLERFHSAFNLPIGDGAALPTRDEQILHHTLLKEELQEFKDGCENGDIPNIAHELADIVFIALSSVVSHGLQESFTDVLIEICDANMSKLKPCSLHESFTDDETIQEGCCNHAQCMSLHREPLYREDGKVMRGSAYFYPDVKGIIEKHEANRATKTVIKDHIENK